MKKWSIVGSFIVILLFGCACGINGELEVGTEEIVITETEMETETAKEQYPIILTPNVDRIDFALESEAIFCICSDEKYGYMKKSGEEITGYIYEMAYPFSEGLGCAKKDGKYGYVDENGEVIFPFEYDDAAPFQEGLAYFVKDDNYGFMRKDGSVAFYLGCDSVSSFSEDLAYFSLDGKYGYINSQGNTVIEPIYNDVDYFKDGLAFVALNGYKGAIDAKGEILIPIKYDKLTRVGTAENTFIIAVTSDEKEYYDLSGTKVSTEEYEKRQTQENVEEQGMLHLKYKENPERVVVLDENDAEILSVECDGAICHVFGNYENYIIKNYGSDEKDSILLLEGCKKSDISGALVKHAITPKKEGYWEEINQNWSQWYEYMYTKRMKVYDIDGSGNPILYCYEAPCVAIGFPQSNSAFYAMIDGKTKELVWAEECGGSMRGDYTCLWRDTESGKVFLGTEGAAGGFGGYAEYGYVYDYRNGEIEEIFSYEWIMQYLGNYPNEEIEETPQLFYNDEGEPYTKETIKEAESAMSYLINGKRVTVEEFEESIQRYIYISLYR